MVGPASSHRLSPRARTVLDTAHELARRDRTVEPDSGHILIALLRTGDGIVDDTAGAMGLDYEATLAAVEAVWAASPGRHELHATLAAADDVTRRAGQVVVTGAHLLVAVTLDGESVAARALHALAIDPAALVARVRLPRDMLVPLLALPDPADALQRCAAAGVTIQRAKPWDARPVREFVETHFTSGWADESATALARMPASLFLARRGEAILGFATYDCAARGIWGPTGVAQTERGSGVARALLLRSLADMRAIGYVYAIIGAVGPAEFYERTCNAVLLPSDWPSYVTAAT